MCGITGFISPVYNREHLQSITQTIRHRGPDAEGLYFEQAGNYNIGLGHRRLSIIDLSSAANQPMHSHNGRYVMVYNGEVYNFKEIRNERELFNKEVNTAFQQLKPSDSVVINNVFARRHDGTLTILNTLTFTIK